MFRTTIRIEIDFLGISFGLDPAVAFPRLPSRGLMISDTRRPDGKPRPPHQTIGESSSRLEKAKEKVKRIRDNQFQR